MLGRIQVSFLVQNGRLIFCVSQLFASSFWGFFFFNICVALVLAPSSSIALCKHEMSITKKKRETCYQSDLSISAAFPVNKRINFVRNTSKTFCFFFVIKGTT